MNLLNTSIRILAYHSVNDLLKFEKQIIYINNNYSVITLNDLNDCCAGLKKFPEKPVLITFDDGDITIYKNALPILKRHRIPATIFAITNLLNTNNPFWWDEIEYYLGKEAGNKKVWEVKKWANKERVAFLMDLRERSEKPELVKEQLTSDQLSEMQEAGIIIANHSHTHPMFDQCTQEELVAEMVQSTQVLKELGFTPDIFAYPNGNYSEISEGILMKKGVKLAFLFDHKINIGNFNPLRISRLRVNDNTSIWKLRFILSGWHGKFLPIIKVVSKLIKT